MSHYDQPLAQIEQTPLAHNQVQQVLHVAATLDHIRNPVQFGDYVASERDITRHAAEAKGHSPAQGEAALIGMALGTAANGPAKAPIFRTHAAELMDGLSEAGMDDADKSFVWNAANHIADSGANTAVIMDVVAGIEGYAAYRESEGTDGSLIRTTLFAMGFGASTRDQATKSSMAAQLRKQVR